MTQHEISKQEALTQSIYIACCMCMPLVVGTLVFLSFWK